MAFLFPILFKTGWGWLSGLKTFYLECLAPGKSLRGLQNYLAVLVLPKR